MIDFEAAKNEILEWVADAIRVPAAEILDAEDGPAAGAVAAA